MRFLRALVVWVGKSVEEIRRQRRVALLHFVRGVSYGAGTGVAGVAFLWLRSRYGG